WTTWLSWILSTNRRTKSTLNLLTQFDLIITGSTIESRCLTTQTATFHLSPVSPSLCLLLIKTSSSEQCRALPSATPSIPDLLVVSTHGTIQLHDFVGDGWAILFSPTPGAGKDGDVRGGVRDARGEAVGVLLRRQHELAFHVSCSLHCLFKSGCKVRFPIVVDHNREAIRQLNMVDLNQKDADGVELPSRALHVIGPDKIDQAQLPLPCNHREKHGRSGAGGGVLQKTANFEVATPVNWKPGEPVVMEYADVGLGHQLPPRNPFSWIFPYSYHFVRSPWGYQNELTPSSEIKPY
ncbi:hypothetical protein B296_00051276, partial [Ensete ventricosum]